MVAFIQKMLNVIVEQALMPTGKNLVPTLVTAISIFFLNVILRIIGFPCLLSWQGILLAVVVLVVILVIERSEYSAVSKLYGDVELRIKDLKERNKASRAGREDGRTPDMSKESAGDAGGRAD